MNVSILSFIYGGSTLYENRRDIVAFSQLSRSIKKV